MGGQARSAYKAAMLPTALITSSSQSRVWATRPDGGTALILLMPPEAASDTARNGAEPQQA